MKGAVIRARYVTAPSRTSMVTGIISVFPFPLRLLSGGRTHSPRPVPKGSTENGTERPGGMTSTESWIGGWRSIAAVGTLRRNDAAWLPASLRSKLVLRENRAGSTIVTRILVTTKLHVPKTRTNLVARPRLREALGWNEGRKLTLVSAPAGFGKTTLLAEWTEDWSAQGRSVAWFSLDESDNDPSRFLSYLVGALQTAEGGIGEGVVASLRSP
jgi:hypothetical protein